MRTSPRHGQNLPELAISAPRTEAPHPRYQCHGPLPSTGPSKKLHRAALNHFFDSQVKRHAVVLNPVSSVQNEKHSVDEDGRTPEIPVKDAKKLFGSPRCGRVEFFVDGIGEEFRPR